MAPADYSRRGAQRVHPEPGTVPREMAVDSFLKLDGIPGESADAKHKGEIEVLAFSWGVSNQAEPGAGRGRAASKAHFEDLLVVARTSKASPKLWLACASGQHVKSAVLVCRKAAAKAPLEFLKVTLSDVTITSYEIDGSDEEAPLDQFALAFARAELEYVAQDATGKPQPSVKAGWDVKKNAKV
ncbi:MAG TPA: type VI secretion system tube protein Hcp [Gaiellaceae bacterium]|nr:type VI secretion system tube protein Hcp [Gaiellaceae bacterium]